MGIKHVAKPTAEQREKNQKYKIAISYPPMPDEKGTPCLGQNRQFQWFNNPTFIYPMVPSYAASLLQEQGYNVMWDDAIAEELEPEEWLERIKKFKPNLIAMETKTPVVKRHWKVIEALKEELPKTKIVLFGDHVTAMPEESMKNSAVDVVATGGDYDFLLLNIANSINHQEKLEAGIWYKARKFQNPNDKLQINSKAQISNSKVEKEIRNTGHFILNHDLDELPMIDRDLTKWKQYAYKNGNYKVTPGTYTYAARDCWWGKCAFCLTGETQVLTVKGACTIADIEKGERVLTHLGNYQKVNETLKREHNGKLIEIKANCLTPFKITPDHRILSLPAENLSRCLKTGLGSYLCKSNNNFSKRLDCAGCRLSKPFLAYKPEYLEAGRIKKGDYLAVPINKEIAKTVKLDLRKILNLQPTIVKTKKKISGLLIKEISALHQQGKSERIISSLLKIDRETIHRYLVLEESKQLVSKIDPLRIKEGKISFEGGKSWVPAEIALNEKVYRLFGYYLAEGCVSKLKNRPNSLVLSFTFSQKEHDFIKEVCDILKNSFKIKANIFQNNVNNTTQISVGNTVLAKVFENLFGDNCYNKNLPEFIMKAEREKQIELLRGIFRGDAHYRRRGKRTEYILSTVSDGLASQLVMILLRCSAIPSVRKSKLSGKMTKVQNIITLSTMDIVNLFSKEKQEGNEESIYKKGFILEKYAYLPVTRLNREHYSGEVYNLSVDKDHSYTANFVGVSNCSWTTLYPGKDYRKHSVKRMLDEIGILIEKYHVREIMDDSGSFPVGPWLKEFCEGMIERGYNKKVIFDCNMRLKALNQEEYDLMGKAGFRFILYGLESANQKTLDHINKNLKVAEIEKGVKMAKKGGLEPHITTMMGYPWESREDAERTVKLSKSLFDKGYVDTLQATIVIPYPGTPLYKECKEKNWLSTEDWDNFDQRMAIMKSPLTEKDIKELTQELYKSFMTPKFIMRKILGVRHWSDVKFLFRAAGKVLGHLTDFSSKKKAEKTEHGCDSC